MFSRAIEIGTYYQLGEDRMFILSTAAWFHDTGYLFVGSKGHEKESVHIMQDFLTRQGISPGIIDSIAQCIRATEIAAKPVSLLEEILCDADTYHFGTLRFRETDELIKKEIEVLSGVTFKKWVDRSIAILANHRFYTSYCQEKLGEGKALNIVWLHSLE